MKELNLEKSIIQEWNNEYDFDNVKTFIEKYLKPTTPEEEVKRNLKSVTIRNTETNDQQKIFSFPEYGIKVKVFLDKLFNQFEGGSLEVTVIDNYPLLSVENEDVLKTFISMKMYKKNGELVNVKNVKEEIMPEILFPTNGTRYSNCIYYDESKEKLWFWFY